MILITGATGLVGYHLVKEMASRNLKFKCLKRKSSDTSIFGGLENKIEWIEADLLDPLSLIEATKDTQTIIHLGAIVSFDKNDKENLINTNIEGTANLVNASLENKASRFIHLSSIAALGKNAKSNVINESNKWEENSNEASTYAKSKHLAELEVWRAHAEGLNCLVLNPSVILGNHPNGRSSSQLLGYIKRGNRIFPEGQLHYVDVSDVIKVILNAIDSENNGERYIVSAGKVDYAHFFKACMASIGSTKNAIIISRPILKLAYYVESIIKTITRQPQKLTKEMTKLSRHSVTYDNSKVKKDFNISFTSLDKALEKYFKKY
ncbi:NAD-dependent epimerase/dehydratase family protein [Aureibacter tunicatorum]|uniref:Nucleoside-diphosphate-sugar epimerase n=1 Tax=Aureibacter tunicatorum TaxID=866807 RepID=A0AAE3XII1_9BACT|nr:NAD-dependent epimerase/dehydratase family protein [Aureibacter tunicatorum]MDR6237050.1 nucleoside-diphosphate-sugar epimerase [Aureibacter tunicatorum]BDD06042.1 epimerase [Aureibacter tunicatorum]